MLTCQVAVRPQIHVSDDSLSWQGLVVADSIPLEKARLICAVEGVDDRCMLVDADVASKAAGKAVISFPFSMGRHMAFVRQLNKMTQLECVRKVVAFPFLLAAAWGVRAGGTFCCAVLKCARRIRTWWAG